MEMEEDFLSTNDDIKVAEILIELFQNYLEGINRTQEILYSVEKSMEKTCKATQIFLAVAKAKQIKQKEQ